MTIIILIIKGIDSKEYLRLCTDTVIQDRKNEQLTPYDQRH